MKTLLISVLLSVCSASSEVVSSVNDLPYDENGRLSSHVLIYSEGRCASLIENYFASPPEPLYGYELRAVKDEAQEAYFGGEGGGVLKSPPLSPDDCRAVCVERGVEKSLVTAAMPFRHYEGGEAFGNWFRNSCQKVEVGFMNYAIEGVNMNIYWKTPQGTWRFHKAIEAYGEKGTFCFDSYLGHVFKFENAETGEELQQYTVEYTAMVSIGEAPPYTVGDKNFTAEIEDTLNHEWTRHNRITRTFSSVGFRKGRLPNDLFASMGAFHYNNYNNKVREEWTGRGVFVNWWEYDVLFIQIPWTLKQMWAKRLQSLVEYWVGEELEETSMYGLRRYEEGARLLTHVDRHSTHAASLIVNVAQGNLEEPWTVEVHDHADRLHQVIMEPGDIVYYESARCLHGRNTPLKGKGSYYVNLFTHYRPIGDPMWYQKPNPDFTPEPLIDIGECALEGPDIVGEGVVKCEHKGIGEHLSPSMFTAKSGEDLFHWWEKVGPEEKPAVQSSSSQEL